MTIFTSSIVVVLLGIVAQLLNITIFLIVNNNSYWNYWIFGSTAIIFGITSYKMNKMKCPRCGRSIYFHDYYWGFPSMECTKCGNDLTKCYLGNTKKKKKLSNTSMEDKE